MNHETVLNGRTCTCTLCIALDLRLSETASNMERLALHAPPHVSADLQASIRTIRRGLLLPTAEHKMALLEECDELLNAVTAQFARRSGRNASVSN